MASQNDIITSQRINFIIDWTKHIISYYMLIVLSYHFLQWHIIWYSHRQPVSWWRFTCIGCVDAWWKEMKRKRWANGWPMGGQWVANGWPMGGLCFSSTCLGYLIIPDRLYLEGRTMSCCSTKLSSAPPELHQSCNCPTHARYAHSRTVF